MRSMFIYIVNADHVAPEYRATNKEIDVREDNYGEGPVYYANAHPYGCGKNDKTPEGAIKRLLSENGCKNIRVVSFKKV